MLEAAPRIASWPVGLGFGFELILTGIVDEVEVNAVVKVVNIVMS